ncbi:hypothetical protein M670_01596 [Schinkia azotoformans MEV2011]|uniref:Ethanolamine utilization protein n=1 Tax=Schinkia azotoformans MEV2011 TaxID=1348973 RepID=A0A072P142_SCHAZ|nr:hypothetical protein [Schinkia azotoformans]KEF39205.1 hypothetical protein M670_01596 [Schinkia azotoformans MEV2011]MEC1695872.1 hypothetical protein [Schinkia azotoformans]MEC1726028.1 hypothetical protein [Schinkia azotoformans]MEC1772049.1 hypothetical protein [Schinkia azotoformans]MEC1781440.1 hypothetical protein [Schinkia azotoformans]
MIDPKVIENIVNQVLTNLEIEGNNAKPNLLVITQPGLDIEQEINLLKQDWNIVLAKQADGNVFSSIDQAVFLNIDQDTFVRAALGLSDSPNSQLFVQLIMNEIPIMFVLDASLHQLLQKDDKNHYYSFYIKMLCSYKETIEKFGVTFKSTEELKMHSRAPINKRKEQSKPSKTLISLEDIMNVAGNQLVVQQGTIITPLAKDKARELGIQISFS